MTTDSDMKLRADQRRAAGVEVVGGERIPDPSPSPHPWPMAGRPLIVPQEDVKRPTRLICRRCQVGTREPECWNCGGRLDGGLQAF